MVNIRICFAVLILLIGCSRSIPQLLADPGQRPVDNSAITTISNADIQRVTEEPAASRGVPVPEKAMVIASTDDLPEPPKQNPSVAASPKEDPVAVREIDLPKQEQNLKQAGTQPLSQIQAPNSHKKNGSTEIDDGAQKVKPQIQDYLDEAERDIMEEALALLNESHSYWVNGDLENALEMLDQAYALLLDANGSPDIARQKDDLRLMISKRILSIYNSVPTVAKGKRSEVPVITNPDVEKEIRQFQTVERDFFISSYQRSAMYLPIILGELKKAGLPEELAWLPLVESGFKINALSTARALGLWQFIPSTGYKYGLNRDEWVDERMDIEKSTRAAIDYLKELHTMFGDWLTVLAAYNCGEGRVIRTIASQHINYLDRFWDLYQKLPYETARYVPRFLATLLIIRAPQKYGIELGVSRNSALSYETVEVNKPMRLQDIAQKLETAEDMMCILNAELRHKVTPDRPYKLKVPTELTAQFQRVIDDIPEVEMPRVAQLMRKGTVIKHKVREGETLASIANKYKISSGAIQSYNKLSNKKRLVAGQYLSIPIRTTKLASAVGQTKKEEVMVRHKVQKGDTLGSLAKRYGTSVSEIKQANALKNDRLVSGQVLRIERGSDSAKEQPNKSVSDNNAGKGKANTRHVSIESNESKKVKKYIVKKGDSLNKIARENGMSVDKLLNLNKLANTDSIYPGQIILIQ